MSSSTAGIESEEQIAGTTGTGGNYSIISIEILSKPVNIYKYRISSCGISEICNVCFRTDFITAFSLYQ